MSVHGISRRKVLRLGAVVLGYSLLTTTADASGDGLAVLALASQEPTPAQVALQGVWLWQRTSYADGATVACSDPSKYTLTLLANGAYGVQADCNQGSGTYEVAGSQLTLQPGPMTRAACPPDSQDTIFLRDLGQVATYVFDGENLVLNLRMDSGNMVFSPRPPLSLTGRPWQVIAVNNGRGAVASVASDTQLDVTFGEHGIVSGSTGCNAYRGLYSVAGTRIAFGSLITTRQACPSEAATEQEQAFLTALGASTRYEPRGDRLTLRDDEGATQVDLIRPPG